MAFAAPVAGRVAAGAATRSAAARSAKATSSAKAARVTAPERARQLLAEGRSRTDAARILRDEYGSTLEEARGLLGDVAPQSTGRPAGGGSGAPPADPPATRRPLPSPSKVVRQSADAAGGVLLGLLGYVLTLTYLRGGSDGVRAWLRAKFLNDVGGPR